MKRNIALVISYDGTEYAGWQRQNNQRSVQETMETALADLHGVPTALTGAGRTDAGVHALGQAGNFFTAMDTIPDWQFRDALNARLPRDIRILKSREVPESFHARRCASGRHYEYHIAEGRSCPAHFARFLWLVPRLPSLRLLNEMAGAVCGSHDFTAFTAAGDSSLNFTREIYHAVFLSEGPRTLFRIHGNAFLWRMVRSLLGTLLDTALRGGGKQAIQGILEAKDRGAAGPTAPARGLFLSKVDYGPEWGIY
ncbi:MAG: tRNA pseudouridine(38-40) synthase TruA [Spirochaeta sp. LUC14_002_19_P3]|nr:MAG: tRNA pseudouridine(38-40) synthase TruA [Spirochaeta sp. LUC14_002_19_P3]